MSTPASASAEQKRPPGPHNQNIELVPHTSPPQPAEKSSPNSNNPSPHDSSHQHLVLTDPIAFRYLEEDPGVTVIERRQELQGYEIYIVEQWATSRTHPTFVITTYTGDPNHVAQVGILSVPTDESGWSQRLRVYFKALNQYHARRRETSLGILMITNLSGFPSSLTVIPVPDGDLRKHRFDFFVNENLKRMGCSGRVGLNLSQPNGATIAKFHQLYKTSDKNSIYASVIELVKLCQVALNLFDKLDVDYADGLLCDITEKAINDWWLDIGAEFYNIEPYDGILGPTTVAALLGLLMGARNRLNAVNAPVPKDPFDIEGMKRGISHFQKNQRLERNRRLDRHTLDRLQKASAKAANAEGWSVPRAVKSTVAELSGKGGEMLAEVVGRRDKAGIADIETPNIDRFEQLVYGQRCKWLWLGKPLKNASVDLKENKPDEHGAFGRMERKTTQETIATRNSLDLLSPTLPSSREGEESSREEPYLHRSVTKRATGLFNDGRRGFGKFKDAVRGHHPKGLKDDTPMSPIDHTRDELKPPPDMHRSRSLLSGSPTVVKSTDGSLDQALKKRELQRASTDTSDRTDPKFTNHLFNSPLDSTFSVFPLENPKARKSEETSPTEGDQDKRKESSQDLDTLDSNVSRTLSADATISIAESDYGGVNLHDLLPSPSDQAQDIGPILRRTASYSEFETRSAGPRPSDYYPRRLSFSLAEDSITQTSFAPPSPPPSRITKENLQLQYEYETNLSSDLKALRAAIASLDRKEGEWTRSQLLRTRDLLSHADNDQQYLDSLYHPAARSLQDLRDVSTALLRDEKEALLEGAKELETLAARLDYEIDGLKGKIGDVEEGVEDFERAVQNVEDRLDDLERPDQGTKCVVM